MNKIILSLAAASLLVGVSVQAFAGPVSGAVIGATSGAVIAGPPGAVVGGVVGAVVGGPNIRYYHHHRVYMVIAATTGCITSVTIIDEFERPGGVGPVA